MWLVNELETSIDNTAHSVLSILPVKLTETSDTVTQSKTDTNKVSLSQPFEGSLKWAKRSSLLNAKRRLKYKLDPEKKRLNSKQYYDSPREARTKKILDAYHANPSPAKQ